MIAPVCDRCHEQLTEFGALLFGPPDGSNYVHKRHLCVACYLVITEHIDGTSGSGQ